MKKSHVSELQLLIRTRELEAFRGLLNYLQELPPSERLVWLDQNVETLSRAFNLLVDFSNKTLDQINVDPESLKLSSDLLSNLKETEDLVDKILNQNHQLRS